MTHLIVFFLQLGILFCSVGAVLSAAGLRRFKVGGLTFLQLGRLSLSFCVRRGVRS